VRFASDRLQANINEYNQKRALTGKAKAPALPEDDPDAPAPLPKAAFVPIQISEDGLELIEWISLDCTAADGPWHADAEIKSGSKPLRLQIRNIAGDESILTLTEMA
jgi:adenine-specific DNA-methyltransferase